jgi:RNA polymerase sigma factor (sigma-70 family)
MGETSPSRQSRQQDVDWTRLQSLLRRVIQSHLGKIEDADLEDCVQEAYLRLIRHLREEEVRNTPALATTVARRTAIDWLRRHKTARERFVPLGLQHEQLGDGSSGSAEPWDRRELLAFLIVQFFRERRPSCCSLAEAYLDGRNWKIVAAAHGKSYDALRQEWTRCRQCLFEAVRANPGPWLELLLGDE